MHWPSDNDTWVRWALWTLGESNGLFFEWFLKGSACKKCWAPAVFNGFTWNSVHWALAEFISVVGGGWKGRGKNLTVYVVSCCFILKKKGKLEFCLLERKEYIGQIYCLPSRFYIQFYFCIQFSAMSIERSAVQAFSAEKKPNLFVDVYVDSHANRLIHTWIRMFAWIKYSRHWWWKK